MAKDDNEFEKKGFVVFIFFTLLVLNIVGTLLPFERSVPPETQELNILFEWKSQ